jgi:hypothetical protein
MSWDDDDAIGRGRPPKWTRFIKGQSGNEKGRPRRVKAQPNPPSPSAQDDALRTALEKKVDITEGGKRRPAKMGEVVQEVQIATAAKGNPIAQRDVLRAARELEERDRERAAEEERLRIKVFAYIVARRAEQARAWTQAAARGVEPDQPWPHPDDFILNERTATWRIRGPFDSEGVYFYEDVRAKRDLTFVQSIVYLRQGRKGRVMGNFFATLCMQYDVMLPLRWQMTVDGWLGKATCFIGLPVPLLRAIQAAVERTADSFYRLPLIAAEQKSVYKATNRVVQPILRPMGYRSQKQFEAAFAELGNNMPWPRSGPVKRLTIGR